MALLKNKVLQCRFFCILWCKNIGHDTLKEQIILYCIKSAVNTRFM
jgi:hypothetical protein